MGLWAVILIAAGCYEGNMVEKGGDQWILG
jgi:hypothetical protein